MQHRGADVEPRTSRAEDAGCDEIHSEPGDAGCEHPAARHAWRIGKPADRLPDDPETEPDEDDGVDERGQDLGAPPPEAPLGRRWPPRQPRSEKREPERKGIGEHVRRVGEQGDRPGREPGCHLDAREAEHERERDRECPALSSVRVHGHTVAPRKQGVYDRRSVAGVTFQGVSKVYPDGTRAVNDLNLGIQDGEFMVLVGPSGCGKTTALRMVAGLEDISEGQLKIGERVVNHVPPRDRDIAMVFQSYALYPHLSVYDNIAFGLKLKKMPKAEIDKRVQEAAQVLGLESFLDRKPRALSGGQRQRVAMGRAIVREPSAFLMDEPLSNLDAKLRVQMRAEIAKLQSDLGTTTVYVTHDQVEAMTMGDRVAVMRKGELQQVAEPQELYDRPLNLFVGGFIGSPAMNLVEATLERVDGSLAAVAGSQRIVLGDETLSARPALKQFEGKPVILGIRPEDLEDAQLAPEAEAAGTLAGEVQLTEALGSEVMVHFSIDASHAITDEVRELRKDAGTEDMSSSGPADGGATMVGRFGARSKARKGEPIKVAVDTRALHFFDPETGLGIYDGTKGDS